MSRHFGTTQSASAAFSSLYASKQPSKESSSSSSSSRPAFLHQLAGESDWAYFKRLSQTASDSKAFEKMVLGEQKKDDSTTLAAAAAEVAKTQMISSSSSTTNNNNTAKTNNMDDDDKKRKRGYQRAEDWEKDQEKELKAMSWEERVQFDGQQHGNKFQQNEILRKNLH
jgi:hypothetical protein